MKKILLIPLMFLFACNHKQVKEPEETKEDSEANYISLGKIHAGFGLNTFKLTVDSIDYIVVSRLDGGTAIIKHGKTKMP